MRPPPPFYPLGPVGVAKLLRHLPNFGRLYWRLFWDGGVSMWPKLMLVMAGAYAFWPVDLLFDWLQPLLGQVDDLLIVAIALRLFIPLCPPHLVDGHVRAIDEEQ